MNRSVTVITTGGTIASEPDPSGVRRPVLSAGQLIAAAGAEGAVRVREELSLDSSRLTFEHLDRIRRVVAAELADPDVAGVVVTHGTDTLEETALLLDLMVEGAKPVVLTGAALPASDPGADGPANLRAALALAASPAGRTSGVVVCFAGEVLAARGLHKRHTGSLTIFGGGQPGPSPKLPARDIADVRVDVVGFYPGADRVGLDAYAAAGARGLVLETMGNGGVPDGVAEAVAEHVRAGVAVVACSRVHGAPVTSAYAGGSLLARAGAILASELRAPQARVQLAAVLANSADPRQYPW